MKRLLTSVVLLTTSIFIFALAGPKQEFRAVWLSTVANIDWPEKRLDSEAEKQKDLIRFMDTMKEAGLNAVVFQVRPACDAMYRSPYEPWSYWFSGEQGKGPDADSLWDPLEFAIREAHRRGMELHALVNPYRAVKDPALADSAYYLSDEHISRIRPDWILRFRDVHILDPGKAEVRDYITKIFMDIVSRYDIDGLHMDDYFYPYSGITNEDSLTFAEESRGFTNIHDWRRDNINQLVKTISDSIDVVKPWVKWGISPFGIYRPGIPKGIEGFDAWSVLYCDPVAWLEQGTVDYITPQCYWPFGGGQDYGTLIPYWSNIAKKHNRHFYPGQALYRAGSERFPEGEIPRQIRLNRETEGCQGSVFFTANNFYANPKNTIDSLRMDLYSDPALWPVMEHQQGEPAAMPIAYTEKAENGVRISWEAVEGAWGYVVYRSNRKESLTKEGAGILFVTRDPEGAYFDITQDSWYYAVTALNPYKRESDPGLAVYDFVEPLKPGDRSRDTWGKVRFAWHDYPAAETYHIQVATDREFSEVIYEERLLEGKCLRKQLPRNMDYYWRIKADNVENWSPVWSFSR